MANRKETNARYYAKTRDKCRRQIFYKQIKLQETHRPQLRTMKEFGLTEKKCDELLKEALEAGEEEEKCCKFYNDLKAYVRLAREEK